MTKPKVIAVVQQGRPEPPLERLKNDAEIIIARSEREFRAAQNNAEILFLNDFRSNFLKAVGPGNLRWIHTSSIGVDALLTREIVNSKITVSNTRGVYERPIAEWVLGVLLMFAKDLRRTLELQREKRWVHRETELLQARKVVILGAGPVGREITKLLRAVGMKTIIVGRSARKDQEFGSVAAFEDLNALLPDAHDVVLALPLTSETQGLFDAERLSMMRRGARLINVGRGGSVVEKDLCEAIDSGHLSGAALDVFQEEPLPQSSPLWDGNNILVSPHVSGDLVGWRELVVSRFEENLKRWKMGEPLRDVVDLEKFGLAPPLKGRENGSQ